MAISVSQVILTCYNYEQRASMNPITRSQQRLNTHLGRTFDYQV